MRELLEIMGQVILIVMVGLLMALPTTLAVFLAIEYESWLLGALAFAVLILTFSIGIYLMEAE